MNREEIQHELDEATKRRMEISDNILGLKEQLAEAEKLEKLDKLLEKPKRRHGDFGVNYSGNKRITLFRNGNDGSERDDYCPYGMVSDSDITVFGNVFDLMKGWDKPFENCEIVNSEKDEFYFHLEAVNRKHISFKLNNTGNWFHASISEAEEIWHKLGHAIAELKQKKEISGKK